MEMSNFTMRQSFCQKHMLDIIMANSLTAATVTPLDTWVASMELVVLTVAMVAMVTIQAMDTTKT